MSNKFQIIDTSNQINSDVITSMHRLRYSVFYEELKWRTGLNIRDFMEFDEYDQSGTQYLVHVNEHNIVDAACRLIPTNKPYMLAEHYADSIESIAVPCSNDIWEISRFCTSPKARRETKGKITSQLTLAIIEFGLMMNIKNYIALATDSVVPVMRRIVGWDPTPLGVRRSTPEDHAYSVLYTVSMMMLDRIRKKHNIEDNMLLEPSSAGFQLIGGTKDRY